MVWAVSTLHSPLRPAAAGEEGWLGEAQSASTPCPFLALPSPSRRHPLHARASGPAAAASRGRTDPDSLLPSPPAACSTCPWHARGAAVRPYKQPGGRVGKNK